MINMLVSLYFLFIKYEKTFLQVYSASEAFKLGGVHTSDSIRGICFDYFHVCRQNVTTLQYFGDYFSMIFREKINKTTMWSGRPF